MAARGGAGTASGRGSRKAASACSSAPWTDHSVQIVFVILLIGVLIGSVASFAVMGISRRRHMIRLARRAVRTGMRFSAGDLFDAVCRYGAFDLIRSGHSPHASNVTYGRLEGWTLRAFDFRCELGHGTRRLTRLYGVVIVETDLDLPPVLMWHERDLEGGPMVAGACAQKRACWFWDGDAEWAARLAELCSPLAPSGLSLQTCGPLLMLCLPAEGRHPDYAAALDRVGSILEGVRSGAA